MTFIYTPNTPQANHFPSDDQPLMNQNFQYLLGTGPAGANTARGLLRDHNMTLNTANAPDGIHLQVRMPNQTTPGFTNANSVIYVNNANTDSQIFFNNVSQNVQLTTAKAGVPNIVANGCSFLPGGLLIQWGRSNNGGTFTPNFTTLFSVTSTPNVATGFLNSIAVINSATNAGFTMQNSGGQVFPVYWVAIGLA
jgi:hypothetical protein